jgi:hypothetical protein
VTASVTALAGVLGAVGLLLLLVTWAASIGPQQVLTDPGDPRSYPPRSPTTATASPQPGGSSRPAGGGQHDVLFAAVTITAALLGTVVMLAALLTVLRWLLTRDWRRHRPEPEPADVAFDPLEAPAALVGSMTADYARQRELLAEGSPRNAIVACWHRFETLAEEAGVRRHRWETSSEFTLRVLDRLSADHSAVLELAELYRDARHSAHEITEADRARAAEALDVLQRSLGGTVTRAPRGGGP